MNPILPVFGIDDDPQDTEMIVDAFKKEGITDYEFFVDSNEFLYVFNENVPVAVIDYNLPGTNGQIVLDEAKRKNPAVRAVLISGKFTPEMQTRLTISGAMDFVVKENINWATDLAIKVKSQLAFAHDEYLVKQERKKERSEINRLLYGK